MKRKKILSFVHCCKCCKKGENNFPEFKRWWGGGGPPPTTCALSNFQTDGSPGVPLRSKSVPRGGCGVFRRALGRRVPEGPSTWPAVSVRGTPRSAAAPPPRLSDKLELTSGGAILAGRVNF